MLATSSHNSYIPTTSGVQDSLATFSFLSPCSEPEFKPIPSLHPSGFSKTALRKMDDEPSIQDMSPLSKLKPFPSSRQFSGGMSEISELFKSASLSSDSAQGIPPPSYAITSHPIHLRHLSEDRLLSCEITPFFSIIPAPPTGHHYNTEARLHSLKFPHGHRLSSRFVELYQLEDELGSGGYGFVMTAQHRFSRREVAVKFIIKEKVPEHAWMEDELLGRLPTEVVLLTILDHENVVKFLDLFEDELYFYLVQELHGAPWQRCEENTRQLDSITSTPSLSPSTSERSLESSPEPFTPPAVAYSLFNVDIHTSAGADCLKSSCLGNTFDFGRPEITRRASYDLFECIEQSSDKRFPEPQARHIFAQVVSIVHYLDSRGITHRDIKDENLVIDRDLKVKLIDFGSACAVDLNKPRPFYTQFFGTAAYASSEIILKKRYQAAPAEIWTLGVLLSYLLTGASPFPSVRAASEGRIVVSEPPGVTLSGGAMDLMHRCLDPDPLTRIKIQQVKEHPWLVS